MFLAITLLISQQIWGNGRGGGCSTPQPLNWEVLVSQTDKAKDREEFHKFGEAVEECFQRIGNQRLALDVQKLKTVVGKSPHQAVRYVEIYCAAAHSQPTLIKIPYIIATILDREHSMSEPLVLVKETAKQVGATDDLSRLPIATDVSLFRTDGPERDAARKWWDSVDLEETSCDRCDKRLRRGQGFSVPPTAGTGAGFDLICQSCFDLHLSQAQDERA
jgi:hypothetical protein